MPDSLEESLRQLAPEAQRRLAVRIAKVVAPYGAVQREVIEPQRFAGLLGLLDASIEAGAGSAAGSIVADTQLVIDAHPDEPDGAGFFAFGAVVVLHYAAEAVSGDSTQGLVHAVRRLRDLVGAADDDGCVGIYQDTNRWLLDPLPDRERDLFARVEADVAGRFC